MFDEMKLNWIQDKINHVYDWNVFMEREQGPTPPSHVLDFFTKFDESNTSQFFIELIRKKQFKALINEVVRTLLCGNFFFMPPSNSKKVANFHVNFSFWLKKVAKI